MIQDIPQEWYREALGFMAERTSALTRRSAGLPAIITGILGAYIGTGLFDEIILDLQAIADEAVEPNQDFKIARLPQVHALNCLKDIFTDARFAIPCERYVADSLEIAATCLDSTMYAKQPFVSPALSS